MNDTDHRDGEPAIPANEHRAGGDAPTAMTPADGFKVDDASPPLSSDIVQVAVDCGHVTNREGKSAKSLPINDITIPEGHRSTPVDAVSNMADSFRVIGQKTPISVQGPSASGKYLLVTGKIRLEAATMLCWTHIEAFVEPPHAVDAERWRLSENYYRSKLTVIEEADHHARLLKLEAAEKGQVVQYSGRGRPKKGTMASSRIVSTPGKTDAANAKASQRLSKISQITEAAKVKAKEVGIDDIEADLLLVAREPKANQVDKVIELANAKAKTERRPKAASLPEAVAPPTQPSEAVIDDKGHVDVLVATLDQSVVRRLQTPWGEEDRLERSLPAQLGQVAGGAVLVQARVYDLPVIVNKFLPICGVELSQVLLVSSADDRDITKMEVVVIAVREGLKAKLFTDGIAAQFAGSFQLVALAESMFPDAKRKVHVFAAEHTDGWECVLREESWSMEPRVQ